MDYLCLATFLGLGHLVSGHVVIEHPAPRHDDDNQLKQYPCGSGGQYNAFDMGPTTVLQPGPQYFEFRETINHNGAPFRLALSIGDDDGFDSYVLMDNIPHFDGGSKKYKVAVNVPDLDCSQCSIQLVQIMTDKFGGTCDDLSNSCGNSAYVYFSCANVQINGTEASVPSFYNSMDGNTAAQPWNDLSSEDWQLEDGFYVLPDNMLSASSSTGSAGNGTSTGGGGSSSAAPLALPWSVGLLVSSAIGFFMNWT